MRDESKCKKGRVRVRKSSQKQNILNDIEYVVSELVEVSASWCAGVFLHGSCYVQHDPPELQQSNRIM